MTSRFPNGEDFGMTNQHEFILTGSLQPLDDLKFEAAIAKYYFDQTPVAAGEHWYRGAKDIGTELDITTTYDYTEDVTFTLLNAWFFPGEVYEIQTDTDSNMYPPGTDLQPQVASEVIGSCKVSF